MLRLSRFPFVAAGLALGLLRAPSSSAAPPEWIFATSGAGIAPFYLGDDGRVIPRRTQAIGPAAPWTAVHPSNRFLYTVDRDTTGVRMFTIRAEDGFPSPAFGTLFSGPTPIMDLTSVVIEPSGRVLYTTDTLVDVVRGFAVDAVTGALTPLGIEAPIGANAGALAVDPAGRFLYAAASGVTPGLYVYTIDSVTGALTPVAGSPVAVAVAPGIQVVDPSGRFLFTASGWYEAVSASAYTIGPTGLPQPLDALPASWANETYDLAITPSGRFLYAAHPNGLISGVALDAENGTLTELPWSPFRLEWDASLLVDPSGRYLIVGPYGSIWSFRIGPDGALTPVPGSPFDAFDAEGETVSTNHDAIFRDGFDRGDATAWSAVTPAGATVVTDAALHGTHGLSVRVVGAQSVFVRDDSPDLERHYRARFRLDPGTFDPGTADGAHRMRIFVGFDAATAQRVFALVLRRRDAEYALSARVLLDAGGRRETPFVPLTPGPHDVQIHWESASAAAASDGSFELLVDGRSVARLDAVPGAARHVDSVRLGAIGPKAGASGELRFDAFESRRYHFIPPP